MHNEREWRQSRRAGAAFLVIAQSVELPRKFEKKLEQSR
jgi:hypothetical protein